MRHSFLKSIEREKGDCRATYIIKNGKNLLEKLIASCNGKGNPVRSFSVEELKAATNNYDVKKVIKAELVYKLYKGFLECRPISVMKFNTELENIEGDPTIQYFLSLNSIVFASQMTHKNVSKLIGCCLETQIPILVFESVEYGTLDNRIHNPSRQNFEPLLWRHRLKIAMEIANAVAYLHVGFPRPIVFRNIKPSNILFHEEFVPKLFDFSVSESIPEGETHIEDVVTGVLRFIAPEYFSTGECNEKSDVYSFGALMLELLTGQRISHPFRDEARTDVSGGELYQR